MEINGIDIPEIDEESFGKLRPPKITDIRPGDVLISYLDGKERVVVRLAIDKNGVVVSEANGCYWTCKAHVLVKNTLQLPVAWLEKKPVYRGDTLVPTYSPKNTAKVTGGDGHTLSLQHVGTIPLSRLEWPRPVPSILLANLTIPMPLTEPPAIGAAYFRPTLSLFDSGRLIGVEKVEWRDSKKERLYLSWGFVFGSYDAARLCVDSLLDTWRNKIKEAERRAGHSISVQDLYLHERVLQAIEAGCVGNAYAVPLDDPDTVAHWVVAMDGTSSPYYVLFTKDNRFALFNCIQPATYYSTLRECIVRVGELSSDNLTKGDEHVA